jgi:two-component system CheB/CheR fusion protein
MEYLVIEELLGYGTREREHLRACGLTTGLHQVVETFALTVHELATNALKKRPLSQPPDLSSWRIDEALDSL